jgi:hypothetical protein
MSYPYQLADLEALLEGDILEYSTTLFPTAELDRALNDGQWDVAVKTLCIENVLALTTTYKVRTVDVTSVGTVDVVKVLGVEYVPTSGTRIGLLPITPTQLGHVAVTGTTPQYFFRWGKWIGIEPLPDSIAGYSLNVYVAQPPSAVLSTLSVPAAYAPLIVKYALFRCLLKLRKFGVAMAIYNDYISACAKLRATITAKYASAAEDTLIPDQVIVQ